MRASLPTHILRILIPACIVVACDEGQTLDDRSPVVADGAYTREEIRLLDPTETQRAYLVEEGREGEFLWVAGDFTAAVTVDTQEGIFIESDLVPADAGVWRRVTLGDGEWHADWFAIPGCGADAPCPTRFAHDQMSAMIALGNLLRPSQITLGSKIYILGAPLTEDFGWQVRLVGSRGFQGTIILKQYVEPDPVRGVLAFGDFGFHLQDLNIRGDTQSGASGGAGVSAVLTASAPAAGRSFLERVVISMGDTSNYGLYVSGLANDTGAPLGYRGLWLEGGEYFGAKQAAIALLGTHHVFAAGTFAATSGGSSTVVLDIAGAAGLHNDDIQWHGVIAGDVNLRQVERSTFVSPRTGNILVEDAVASAWFGARWAGSTTNRSPGEFVFSGAAPTTM